jgi:hypothetical protein
MTEKSMSGEACMKTVLDAYPSPVLILDDDLRIHNANRAAREMLFHGGRAFKHRLCGDLIHCVHALESEGGCGATEFCSDCVLRQTAEAVSEGLSVFRHTSSMKLVRDGKVSHVWFLVTGAPFEYGDERRVVLTLEDITEIIELRRIIPICSHCRKVRDDAQFWQSVEAYLHKYMGVQFSHGICPDCVRKYYPGMAEGAAGGKSRPDEES